MSNLLSWRLLCTGILAAWLLLLAASCNLLSDTGDTAQSGGEGAGGIAEKMSQGIVGGESTDE